LISHLAFLLQKLWPNNQILVKNQILFKIWQKQINNYANSKLLSGDAQFFATSDTK